MLQLQHHQITGGAMRGNVTIGPLDRATAANAPEIKEVRSLKSGLILDAERLIQGMRYDRLVRVRSLIKEEMRLGQPRIVCAICGTAVHLAASTNKAFFFRHYQEDGSCPAQTRTGLSDADIRAMKYKGAQESEPHRRLKTLIERSLDADVRFTDIRVEKTWHGERDPSVLRRPDVQARLGNLRLAFEAQLTTTFLDVVIGRKMFYRDERALLVWVLPHFDPNYRQMTIDDVLFNNNANILVIDNETTQASESSRCFTIRCAFRRPVLEKGELTSIWESRLVVWDDLITDLVGQRLYFFDCEGEERKLLDRRRALLAEAQAARDQALREALFTLLATQSDAPDREAATAAWRSLRTKFLEHGLTLGGEFTLEQDLRNTICGVLSALASRPVGYGFEKLIQVSHHLADHCPAALLPYGHALQLSGNDKLIASQDKNGRWMRKAKIHRAAYRAGDPSYLLPRNSVMLLRFLFPQLSDRLTHHRYRA